MSFKPQIAGVVGAGTMGVGIAQVLAAGGSAVKLFDSFPDNLNSAKAKIARNLEKAVARNIYSASESESILSRINIIDDLSEMVADIVIEAVPENLDLKRQLFERLETVNSEDTILATNTSSIPVSQIASELQHGERMVGIHFFNPAHIMKLVEVIKGEKTDPMIASKVRDWISSLGKVPVMANDRPGFIVNRVARSFYTESLNAVEQEAATVSGIDRLLEASGFRMGPFRLMDLIGIDVNHSVTMSVYEQFNNEARFKPSTLQGDYVERGWHGKKSSKGFYDYEK